MKQLNLEEYMYVKSSEIHGSGLFTSVDIPRGTEIMIISGEVISGEECEKREEDGNVYIFWNGDNYIDTSNTDKIKFINHNCNYNCDILDRDENSLLLISTKNISAGEELTIDYGYDEIYEFCNCKKCSEIVTV